MSDHHPRVLLENANFALKNLIDDYIKKSPNQDNDDESITDIRQKLEKLIEQTNQYLHHRASSLEYVNNLKDFSKWCDRKLEDVAKGFNSKDARLRYLYTFMCFLSLTVSSMILCVMGIILIPEGLWNHKKGGNVPTEPVITANEMQIFLDGNEGHISREKASLFLRFYKKLYQYWSADFIQELLKNDEANQVLLSGISSSIFEAKSIINDVFEGGPKQKKIDSLREKLESSLSKSRAEREYAKFLYEKQILSNNISEMIQDIQDIIGIDLNQDIKSQLDNLLCDLEELQSSIQSATTSDELKKSFDSALVEKYIKKFPRLVESLIGGTLATSIAVTFYALAILVDGAYLMMSLGHKDLQIRHEIKNKYGDYLSSIKRRYDPVLAKSEQTKNEINVKKQKILGIQKVLSKSKEKASREDAKVDYEDIAYQQDLDQESEKLASSRQHAKSDVDEHKHLSALREMFPGIQQADEKIIWDKQKEYLKKGIESLVIGDLKYKRDEAFELSMKAYEIHELLALYGVDSKISEISEDRLEQLVSFAFEFKKNDKPLQMYRKYDAWMNIEDDMDGPWKDSAGIEIGNIKQKLKVCIEERNKLFNQYLADKVSGAGVWRTVGDNSNVNDSIEIEPYEFLDADFDEVRHAIIRAERMTYICDQLVVCKAGFPSIIVQESIDHERSEFLELDESEEKSHLISENQYFSELLSQRDKAVIDYFDHQNDNDKFIAALREIVRFDSQFKIYKNKSTEEIHSKEEINACCDKWINSEYAPSLDGDSRALEIEQKVKNANFEFNLIVNKSLSSIDEFSSDDFSSISNHIKSLFKLFDYAIEHLLLDVAVGVFHVLLVPLEIMYALKWYVMGGGASNDVIDSDRSNSYKGFFGSWGRDLVLAVSEWQSAISHRWSDAAFKEYTQDNNIKNLYTGIKESYDALDNNITQLMEEMDGSPSNSMSEFKCQELKDFCSETLGSVCDELNAQMLGELVVRDPQIRQSIEEALDENNDPNQTLEI